MAHLTPTALAYLDGLANGLRLENRDYSGDEAVMAAYTRGYDEGAARREEIEEEAGYLIESRINGTLGRARGAARRAAVTA